MWAAPAVTTLGGAAFAAGSCIKGASIWKFVPAEVTNRAKTGAEQTGTFDTPTGSLTVVTGNMDWVGSGTGFPNPPYPSPTCLDLTGGGGVTQTILNGASLPSAPYIVELEVFGSIPGENGGNSAAVKIGGSTVISTGNIGDTTTSLFAFSSGATVNGGVLSLDHASLADFRGLFLKRLEVFSATCQ